jgi:hypothetical protein
MSWYDYLQGESSFPRQSAAAYHRASAERRGARLDPILYFDPIGRVLEPRLPKLRNADGDDLVPQAQARAFAPKA